MLPVIASGVESRIASCSSRKSALRRDSTINSTTRNVCSTVVLYTCTIDICLIPRASGCSGYRGSSLLLLPAAGCIPGNLYRSVYLLELLLMMARTCLSSVGFPASPNEEPSFQWFERAYPDVVLNCMLNCMHLLCTVAHTLPPWHLLPPCPWSLSPPWTVAASWCELTDVSKTTELRPLTTNQKTLS